MEKAKEEIDGRQAIIEKMQQDAKDSIVDHKLSEKKRAGMVSTMWRVLISDWHPLVLKLSTGNLGWKNTMVQGHQQA